MVEDIEPEVERAGLTRASIQTDVELKLRLAGIPGDAALTPYLYVNVQVLPDTDGFWPYRSDVHLKQRVLLVRDRSIIVGASTWSVGRIGGVGGAKVSTLRDRVKDLVDQFINAYLSVNPK